MQEPQKLGTIHEGTKLLGELHLPDSAAARPGVLILPSAMGLGPHYRAIAKRIADLGYVALGVDMYGEGAWFSGPGEAGDAYAGLQYNTSLLRSRVNHWLEALRQRPEVDPTRIAAFGYCFGGHCALELARSGADFTAAITFHATLRSEIPAGKGQVKARLAIFTGAKDPYAPQEDVRAFISEMDQAEARWQLTVFSDVYHAFTTIEDGSLPVEGLGYDPLADAVSWAAATAMLGSVFGNPKPPAS